MRPLDIVKIPTGALAIITETNVNGTEASIEYLDPDDSRNDYNAWWPENHLTVVNSLPILLATSMANGLSASGGHAVKRAFPLEDDRGDAWTCYSCESEVYGKAKKTPDGSVCSDCADEYE